MDKGKEVESDSFTDGDASKSEFVENLEQEEEKNLEGEAEEVEIPGHEDSAGVEKENENLGEVEMLEVIKERNKEREIHVLELVSKAICVAMPSNFALLIPNKFIYLIFQRWMFDNVK